MKNKKLLKAILNELQIMNNRFRNSEIRIHYKQRTDVPTDAAEKASSVLPDILNSLVNEYEKEQYQTPGMLSALQGDISALNGKLPPDLEQNKQ